ncbi:hypothetical protein Lal_00038472 [Lupinus albus]|nr:hypothetical protein Lal_00038472 [Lupinus albus]
MKNISHQRISPIIPLTAEKSRPNKRSKPEVSRKTGMGNKTECTGFFARATIKPETKAGLDKTESIMVRRPSLKWNFHAGARTSMKVDLLRPARRRRFSCRRRSKRSCAVPPTIHASAGGGLNPPFMPPNPPFPPSGRTALPPCLGHPLIAGRKNK